MTDVEPSNVPVAGPSEVVCADAMSQDTFINHDSDRSRPHQKSIIVKMNAGIIAVQMETEFVGESLGDEILNVDVCHVNLLIALLERVQAAVRIFLEEIEPCCVVLNAVRSQRAKDANAWLFF